MIITLSNKGLSSKINISSHRILYQLIKGLEKIKINDSPFQVKVKDIHVEFNNNNDILTKLIENITCPDTSLYHLVTALNIVQTSNIDFYNYLISENNKHNFTNVMQIIYQYCYYSNKLNRSKDPNYETYEQIKYKGIPCLYTDIRIDRTKLPKGVYCFETMHDDEGKGLISLISNHIHINFWGTILTTEKLDLNNSYIEVDEDKEIDFSSSCNVLLKDFLYYQNMKVKNKEFLSR